MKIKIIVLILCSILLAACNVMSSRKDSEYKDNSPGYNILCYYFPNWHPDPWNDERFGKGLCEWRVLKKATPKFQGHYQPKVPLWGYDDESQPEAMAKRIDAAADSGIDVFLFDWYWFVSGVEGFTGPERLAGPYLEAALEQGFFNAPNNHRIKFAIMWANHNIGKFFPGPVDRRSFDKITDYIIEKYFHHPSYWFVDGCPYFSFYEVRNLIKGLGGLEQTRLALEHFRARTRAAGFKGLHINAAIYGLRDEKGKLTTDVRRQLVKQLGIDSIDNYVWVHNTTMPDFPTTSYKYMLDKSIEHWHTSIKAYDIPYHPNITMGWDPSPRCSQNAKWERKKYPYTPVIVGNTPQAFKSALTEVKKFLDQNPQAQHTFTIYAWNEWTEGGYLEPDTVNKMAYLNAIKDTFAKK